MADIGRLQVQTFRGNTFIPVANARVTVVPTSIPSRETAALTTNATGQTQVIDLIAPNVELSLDENNTTEQPYSTCDVTVEAEGYETFIVRGCQILPETTALQICNLEPLSAIPPTEATTASRNPWWSREILEPARIVEVPANRLFGNFPPKIPEDPVKPLPPPTGGVVLNQVVVPEFVIVHAGTPTNTAAPNYWVRFQDYIKNVASSEIYATWPENTIRANIYCILSFTLNRIFTEWYRGKGYNFDITNSTAFDHAFTFGRNIFDNISRIVDEIFTTYVRRRGGNQPLLTQYCDGRQVQCPGWLTQWGSKDLGDRGLAPYQILTNFYGTNIDLVQAPRVSGIPKSYPGYTLKIGSRGEPVRTTQTFLNRISQNYPLIPKVAVDGIYGPATANSVRVFQSIFNLPQTGEVDYATWYKISNIYVGVTKIAELRRTVVPKEETGIFIPPVPYKGAINVPTISYRK
jgi:peptidoglycan hydrolase-like protein with peptidoglycan-binding domain